MFQISVPKVVKIRKLGSFILAEPAGIEIRLLIKGMNRQKKIVAYPLFKNHFSAFVMSSGLRRSTFPKRPETNFSKRSTLKRRRRSRVSMHQAQNQ